MAQPERQRIGGGQSRDGILAFAQNQRDEVRDLNDVSGSLAAEPGMRQQTFICTAVDVYNQTIDGEIAASLTAASGGANTSGPKVLAVDCRNGTENPEINGTLQAKSNGGTSVNLQNIVRVKQE